MDNQQYLDEQTKGSSPTSSPQDPETNSGESYGQGPKPIVNEQEQHKSVNQEEYVDDLAANTRFGESDKYGFPKNNDLDITSTPPVTEIDDDLDSSKNNVPNLNDRSA
ncbi:hypothetical protein EXU57_18715 [Segetibacter sp. 3557_3]|uniref:hypothetical protein n=1 Tax=Segetibacter sp. 3557_3 TaxID=2547429 RepID=UPI00105883B3|nr:hypothetical protein [Segetibacter sp. 3557_3]TDH23085.1 hypothetical protein EXU57_18715 [Segetibacter sp. 3557_3]